MPEQKPHRAVAGRALLPLLLLLGAAIAGIALSWQLFYASPTVAPSPAIKLQQATLLPEFRGLPPFSLSDQWGKAFDNRRLLGQWTLLSFGYTHCPDVCPTNLAMLAVVDDRLRQIPTKAPYQIGFVSVDPERDTPEHLAEYVRYFDSSFLGITGDESALQALTRPLGILYQKVETGQSAMGYVMDHSANLILLDPQGRYHALFSPPHDGAKVSEDLLTIMNSGTEP